MNICVALPQVGDVSARVLELLSYTCRGCFLPLCAALGGIVAQEGLKAVTGKFTPLKQWVIFSTGVGFVALMCAVYFVGPCQG